MAAGIQIRGAEVALGGRPVLLGASIAVRPGEVVALAGANGSGKSTLAGLACGMGVAAPGVVSVDGADPAAGEAARREVRALVALVQQDPVDQVVCPRVFDEVAFGPRNMGLVEDEVAARVAEALAAAGAGGLAGRDTGSLSGGELQRVALAGALAMRPRYLVLDEVTSMLDASLRPGMRELVDRLAHVSGVGVLTVTHDPAELAAADRVAVLGAGRVVYEGAPADLVRDEPGLWRSLVGEGPLARRVTRELGGTADEPAPARPAARAGGRGAPCAPARAGLELADVSFAYGEGGGPVLRGVSLSVRPGEVLLLAGASGSGKSTLARVAAGLDAPGAGTVSLDGVPVSPGRVGLAFQRPEAQLFCDTVLDELAFGPRNLGIAEEEAAARARVAVRRVGIGPDLLDRAPLELSGGQQRRVGVGSLLALDAAAYILDEPTAGMDAAGRAHLHVLVRELAAHGAAVAVISHDLEEWLEVADVTALMRAGRVAWRGPVGELAARPDLWALVGLPAPGEEPLAPGSPLGVVAGAAALAPTPAPALAVAPEAVPAGADPAPSPARRAASEAVAPQGLDVRVKVGLLLAASAVAFAAPAPVALLGGAAALAACLPRAGLTPRDVLRAMVPVAALMALTLAANLVSCDGSAAMALAGPMGLDPAGGARGAAAVLRIALLLGLALCVARTCSPTDVADAFVRLMRPLGRLGVPTGDVAAALSIALRFMPVVAGELSRIRLAQRARGARFDEGPLLARVRAHAALMLPLMVGLFRRADRLATSMAARLYRADAATVPPRPLAARDRLALAGGLAACAAALAMRLVP